MLRFFLCGDVMCGRGIDQVLAHPCSPELYESYVRSAEDYVALAEQVNGKIPRRNGPDYIWGAALDRFARMQPDVRIINLETAVTRSNDHADKGINYRISPENADCLAVAKIDCCCLANNHVLDWGQAGLLDTLATLEQLNIKTAGAGRTARQAGAPAELRLSGARLLVFSFAAGSSGVPPEWRATGQRPGINLLGGQSVKDAVKVAEEIAEFRRPGDLIVASTHWGSNWGYDIPEEQMTFARALIDEAGVSIVHGHSSHHPKAIEIYRNRLIVYGCGDFLNDYEGISGQERYRSDLAVMYFVDLAPDSGDVDALTLVPLRIRNFRLCDPSRKDLQGLQRTLDRECRQFGAKVQFSGERQLAVTAV